MSGNVWTAAAVVAAVAATTLGAAGTAVATPAGDNPVKDAVHDRIERAHRIADLRKAGVRGRIDLGTPSPNLPGAPQGSQTLKSATYTMGRFGDTAVIKALCGANSYVPFVDKEMNGSVVRDLDVTVHSSSTFVGAAFNYPQPILPLDTAGEQNQGFLMKLSNDNPTSSNTGYFTWTCVSVS